MEKTKTRDNEQSKLRAFLTGDTFKALLPLIGFAIIIIVLNIMTQGKILTPKKLRLLLSQIYYPTIVAVGVFFVMTLGSIDFTEGSTLGVASLVVSALSFINIPLAILGGILCGAAIGAINGFFHVKFKLQSFIVTICTMYLFRGVCAYFTTETAVPASAAIKTLDNNGLKIGITVAVLLIAFFLFKFTRIGNDVKAVGSGETAARFSGVHTDRVKFLAFVAGAGRPAHHRWREGALLQHHRWHADVCRAEQRPGHTGLRSPDPAADQGRHLPDLRRPDHRPQSAEGDQISEK